MTTIPFTSVLEDLDWAYEPQCEHSEHGTDQTHSGPAAVLVEAKGCCSVKPTRTIYLCESFWQWVMADLGRVECSGCGTKWHPAVTAYRFLSRVTT